MPNQPTDRQDRQRLAAVLETLARVLRSEAEIIGDLRMYTDDALVFASEYVAIGLAADMDRAERDATEAAKLAGVEVAEDAKDGNPR